MTIRVVLADDHQLVRAGLSMLIAETPGYEVVGEAGDGLEALELIREQHPDIVLMDIHMPRLSGLDCLARIRSELPETRIIILSMHSSEEHVIRALDLGALGYLLKDSTPAELELALKSVSGGNIWLSADISPRLLGDYARRQASGEQEQKLTPRQQQTLQLLAEGASTKEIAYQLDLSVKTVETYRSQIMERLGLSDLPSLVRYAIRNGIISL